MKPKPTCSKMPIKIWTLEDIKVFQKIERDIFWNIKNDIILGPPKSAKEFKEYYVNIAKHNTGKSSVKKNTIGDSSKSTVETKWHFSLIKITQALHQLNESFPQVIAMIFNQLTYLKSTDY